MTICQTIGVFLYCGLSSQPLAMFPQPNNLPTAELAQQLIRSRNSNAAPTTTLPPVSSFLDCGTWRNGRMCHPR